MAVEKYYEDTFFNISNPSTPVVSIQFRTQLNEASITAEGQWEEVTLNPNNFFDNIVITDNGGIQKVELTLFDKNFAYIENIITKALVVSRLSNKLAGGSRTKSADGLFTVKVDSTTGANMRVRFGYSETISDNISWINETSFDGKYKNRTDNTGTVTMSPWIYFQIINTKFKVTPTGLRASVSAFSILETFLDKAKILKRFAIIRGTPAKILTATKKLFEDVSDGALTLEFDESDLNFPDNKDGQKIIEINLGTKTSEETESWMSVKSFLNSFRVKIPPKKYDIDGNIINESTEEEESEKAVQVLSYDYATIHETGTDGKAKTIVKFYFPEPEKQKNIRTYIWKDYANSIVKSLDIDSQADFAALNRQIFVVDKNTQETKLFIARPVSASDSEDREKTQNLYLGTITNETEAINDSFKSNKIVFVNDIVNTSESSVHMGEIGARVAQQIVRFLNEGIYRGSLTVPLDPFFLFDSKIRRYQYMIRIVIQRPNYYDDGELKNGGISYLTGNYLVGGITHTINSSGGETKLDIMRWSVGE